MFLAHLVNQSVASGFLGLQIATFLVEHPTDDSVEICVGFMREVGAYIGENISEGSNLVYDRMRAILNEGSISQRVQYMIEVLMQVRRTSIRITPSCRKV